MYDQVIVNEPMVECPRRASEEYACDVVVILSVGVMNPHVSHFDIRHGFESNAVLVSAVDLKSLEQNVAALESINPAG